MEHDKILPFALGFYIIYEQITNHRGEGAANRDESMLRERMLMLCTARPENIPLLLSRPCNGVPVALQFSQYGGSLKNPQRSLLQANGYSLGDRNLFYKHLLGEHQDQMCECEDASFRIRFRSEGAILC